jgi:hypothetical protein
MKGKFVLLLIFLNGFLFAESFIISDMRRGNWYFLSHNNLFQFTGAWFDLFECDKNELRILRNSIYAKHGYIFTSSDLQEYFGQLAWYNGTESNVESKLTDDEKFYISIIQKIEKNYPQVENNTITGLWVPEYDVMTTPFSLDDVHEWSLYLMENRNIRIYPNGIFHYEINRRLYLGLWSFNNNRFIITPLGDSFNYFQNANAIIHHINSDIRFTEYTANNLNTLLKCDLTRDQEEWIKIRDDPGDLSK